LTFNNDLKPALVQLLQVLEIPIDTYQKDHSGSSFQKIIDATQAAWLRKPGQERWEQEEKHGEKKALLMGLFKQLGMIDEVRPLGRVYDHVLVLGATVQRVRTRLAYLHQLTEQGVIFHEITLLGSQRPLDPNIESEKELLNPDAPDLPIRSDWCLRGALPKTESDMIRMVVDQSHFSSELQFRMQVIDTPMQDTAEGKKRRPNTADTIREWLATKPLPGSCLAISNQPYVGYQESVLRSFLPLRQSWAPNMKFYLEMAGPAAEPDITVATTLDTLARWLYQENIRRISHVHI